MGLRKSIFAKIEKNPTKKSVSHYFSMNTRVGIFAQRREHAGRLFHTLAFDYIEAIE